MLLNVFPMSVWPAGNVESADFVYCPLSKKLQPVKAPARAVNPLAEICATDAEKDSLVGRAMATGDLRILNATPAEFERIAVGSLSGRGFDLPKPDRNAPGRTPHRSEIASAGVANSVIVPFAAATVAARFEIAFRSLTGSLIQLPGAKFNRPFYSGPELIGVGPRAPPFLI